MLLINFSSHALIPFTQEGAKRSLNIYFYRFNTGYFPYLVRECVQFVADVILSQGTQFWAHG